MPQEWYPFSPGLDSTSGPSPVKVVDSTGKEWLLEDNFGMPINIQDQTTPPVIIPANQVIATSTLTATVTLDTNTCTIADSTGMSVGDMFIVTSTTGNRFMWGWITNIAGVTPSTITISNYFDYAFESGQEFSAVTASMNVNGSVTRQIFSLRAAEPAGGIDLTVDVTRIIVQIETGTAPLLSDFGDIAGGLTNGLLFRRVDGTYQNILSFRSNAELEGLAYDVILTTSLGFTSNGITARLTFAGQDKIGVALRIATGEDLQFIVSDDLSSLTDMQVMFEGHVVTGT